jgi:ABC-2 type transport system ATP-binding protein
MSSPLAIEVKDLSKSFQTYDRREGILGSVKDLFHREYKTLVAVDKISLDVAEGELLGYLGPNGAGKSTSIKMLTGILQPTSGYIRVCGVHPFQDRKNYTRIIGVVFGQRTQLWWDIAVKESFKLLGQIYGVEDAVFKKRLDKLTEILEIRDILHVPVRKLSLGQRMRCDILASLIHSPRVLFLDEPTIGLDAVAKDSIRKFLRVLNREEKITVLLTTHDLKEIEELCKRIVVLDHGKIIFDGGLDRIKQIPGLRRTVSVEFSHEADVIKFQEEFSSRLEVVESSARRVSAKFDPGVIAANELLKRLVDSYAVADLSLIEPDIEEVITKIYRGEGPKNGRIDVHARH